MAIGAGLRFAVPEIQNLRTDEFTAVNGAIAFGPNGELYRVAWLNEATSVSVVANQVVFQESGTAPLNTTSVTRASQFLPFIVQTVSATDNIAGVVQSTFSGGNIGYVQVAGPMIVTLTASAGASANQAQFVNSGTLSWESTASANALSANMLGAFGQNLPGAQTAISTVRLVLCPAVGWGFGKK